MRDVGIIGARVTCIVESLAIDGVHFEGYHVSGMAHIHNQDLKSFCILLNNPEIELSPQWSSISS